MKVVIALGGNAILPKGASFHVVTQFKTTRNSLYQILPVIEEADGVVITHGNGPQVGVAFLRNYYARKEIPMYPLDVLGAETQGWMGYMISHLLHEVFYEKKIDRDITVVITQVLVNEKDSEFKNPTKPIGPFFTYSEAEEMKGLFDYPIKKDADRGYRITVPSPRPIDIIEKELIKNLVERGNVVIAGGGGGIPLVRKKNKLKAVYGVIDKDLCSAKIASIINADYLLIVTSVERVYLNYGKEDEVPLERINLEDAIRYMNSGHFPKGSMGPKIEAAIEFLRNGGKEVIITSLDKVKEALDGKNGTRIVKE
jgi:carbamate kinase